LPVLLTAKHEELLRELNNAFSDEGLISVFEVFKSLTYSASFLEVEAWLNQLMTREELPIIHGILAMLYLGIDDFERAKEHALMADKKFPDTEIWLNIINSSIWLNFEEQSEPCQIH